MKAGMGAEQFIIVLTNMPERAAALRMAGALIERRLAACVNVIDGCTSVYRWQGETASAQELPMLIKTRVALFPEVEAVIRELHPYELPEIVAVPLTAGSADYLSWLADETRAPDAVPAQE
jgi:periplasmic divalent cation tolerance protein